MLSPEDAEVVQQLAKAGDDRSIARPVINWFFGDEADLRTIGAALGSLGWLNVEPREDEDGWLMSPTKVTDLSEGAILLMNRELEAASANFDATYDGWETSVEKSKQAGLFSKLFGKKQ